MAVGQRRAVPALANPDFEASAPGAPPTGWSVLRAPHVREESPGGNRYLRTNRAHNVNQTVAAPGTRRTWALAYRARGDLGFERPLLNLFLRKTGDDENVLFRTSAPGTDWAWRTASFIVRPDKEQVRLDLLGTDEVMWVDIDDVTLFDQSLANGDFESTEAAAAFQTWKFTGDASVIADASLQTGASALRLGAGGSAARIVAARAQGQRIFIAGRARAESTAGAFTITETWRGDTQADIATTTTLPIAAASAGTFVVAYDGMPAESMTAHVAFAHESGDAVILDGLSRGEVLAFPPVYYANGGDPERALLKLIATWDPELVSGDVEIRTAADALVATVPLTVADGTGSAEWDGSGNLAGDYIARFVLEGQDALQVTLDVPFAIAPATPYAPPAPATVATIERVAWLWLINDGSNDADLRPAFVDAQADGFTSAYVIARPEQWATVRTICEDLAMPFIVADGRVQEPLAFAPAIQSFDRAAYTAIVDSTIGDLFDSPMCIGFAAFDEPLSDTQIARCRDAVAIAATTPGWKPAIVNLDQRADRIDVLRTIEADTWWADRYFLRRNTFHQSEAMLRQTAEYVLEMATEAAVDNRDFFYVLQAFSDPFEFVIGGASLTRALTGVAIAGGARGLVPFVYRRITSFEGYRDQDGGELPELGALRADFTRIGAMGSDLAALDIPVAVASQSGPVFASEAANPLGGSVLFLVNLDIENAIVVDVVGTGAAPVPWLGDSPPFSPTSGGGGSVTLAPGHWGAWSKSSGSVSQVDALPVLPFSGDELTLPVIGSATAGGGAVVHLAFSPSDNRLAVVTPGVAATYSEMGILEASTPLGRGNHVAWRDDSAEIFVADEMLGLRVYATGFALVERTGFLRETGSASRAALVPGGVVTISRYGPVRLLSGDSTAGWQTDGLTFPGQFATSILPLASDAHALLVDLDLGLRSLDLSGTPPFTIPSTLQVSSLRLREGDLSPSRDQVAVARMRRGVLIADVSPTGSIFNVIELPTPRFTVESVAWVREDVLAVGDTFGIVDFYGVTPGGGVVLLGHWRDDTTPGTLRSLATDADNRLAVGYASGRFVVLDTSTVPVPAAASPAWMLLD